MERKTGTAPIEVLAMAMAGRKIMHNHALCQDSLTGAVYHQKGKSE